MMHPKIFIFSSISSSETYISNILKMSLLSLLVIGVTTLLIAGGFYTMEFIVSTSGNEIPEIQDQNNNNCITLNGDCTEGSTNDICCPPTICQKSTTTNQNEENLQVISKCVPSEVKKNSNTNSTTSDNPKKPSSCPYSDKIQQLFRPIRDGDEFDRTIKDYETSRENYLHLSAHRGDSNRNFLLTVRELNLDARKYISSTTENIGKNIFPLIVASETEPLHDLTGVGGTFTLYLENGYSHTISPVSQEYEIRKGIGHIPLGIYGILVPYFRTEHASNWRKPLAIFGEKITETLEVTRIALNLNDQNDKEFRQDVLQVLEITLKYINKWLSRSSKQQGFSRTVTVSEFQEYSQDIFQYLDRSIQIGAKLQMEALIPALEQWKLELGEEKWRQVFAVIPSVWAVSSINPRFQALVEVMSPEQIKNQVFILENGGPVHDLRGILGKIVAHRAAAHLIFGTKTEKSKEYTFALSGRQDILSNAAEDAIYNLPEQNLI